jgi:hypothetical protein
MVAVIPIQFLCLLLSSGKKKKKKVPSLISMPSFLCSGMKSMLMISVILVVFALLMFPSPFLSLPN